MAQRWDEMTAGTIGNDSFLNVELFYYGRKPDGSYDTSKVIPLPDRLDHGLPRRVECLVLSAVTGIRGSKHSNKA